MSNQDKNCIVGAGLVGSLLSLMMAKRGHEVDVYERRPDIRKASLVGGRSINLALSNRGLRALHLVGLEEEVKQLIPGMIYEGEKILGIDEYGYLKHVFLSEDQVQALDEEYTPDKYGHFPGWQYISKKPGMAPLPGVTTKVTVLARD